MAKFYLIIFILFYLFEQSSCTNVDNKPKQTDDNTKSESTSSEESKSKQDFVVKYRIEKEKSMEDMNVNIDLQNILQELTNNLRNQDQNKFSELTDTTKIDTDDESQENDEEDVGVLTPEMEQANNLYHQAMKLINGTSNRQYSTAYDLFKKAADLGHIGAKEELAFAHLMGVYLPMDFNRAKAYFDEGVQHGSPQSHYGLYFMNSASLFPDASISKGLVHLVFAAADGYHLAQMALAYRYWRSINVAYSCELALMFYQQVATHVASKITSASGQLVQRIRLYDEDEHPTQNNIMIDEDLVQYYQLLADRGDAQAQYGLGQLYYLRDTAFDKALYYFRLAAENGNSNAMAYLGKLYSEKNDYIKQNNQTALHFFRTSAEKGNPMGQAGLGMAFYHGAGVEQNYEKAFKFFQLSADQGYVEGQLMLGIMYYNGEGVKRDYKLAIKWLQAASQSGHALGYYNLGQMHATGTGVLRSCTTATELFKNVAERGKWTNMFIEAYNLYRHGNIEQAFMIYLYLAELGYEVAQSNVAYLLDQMSIQLINIYSNKSEQFKRALIYWNRAATQGFHTARVKLGDYFYYGYGTEQNYETAANHYKSASEQSQNAQAMFNLAYMHEKGLGLKRDIHLAKRFYDLAAETSADAYLPVAIILFKLNLEILLEKFYSIFSSTTNTKDENDSSSSSSSATVVDLESTWDLYLMACLFGLIAILYTMRRQRRALRQQQVPVQ